MCLEGAVSSTVNETEGKLNPHYCWLIGLEDNGHNSG